MQFEYYSLLGGFAVVLGVISYWPYFRDVLNGATKPHPFSWFLWGVMDCIALTAQLLHGAGAGAWLTLLTALQTFAILGLSFRYGEKHITKLDWACLVGAILAMGFWMVTSNALYAVVIIVITHLIAFVPTIRKTYWKPDEETVSTYALNAIKWIPAIMAMEAITLTTVLFPAALIVMNGAFVALLFIRRKQLGL